ncbi:MAG TPA: ImmA/IrrE family metallo-endopeptidase [Solirubrobacteraceae bacterium]|jgi:hypothetical protein|nr:ImmA/IrrE family metallo-endopeptidase [Solirubrobacteraceae bacterium]
MAAEVVEGLAECIMDAAGVAPDPPVSLKAIAAYLGVSSIREVDMVEDGRLEQLAGQRRIYIRTGTAPSRRRFTIAHEFGHIVLAGREAEFIAHRSAATADPEERFCNQFAAALLMPRRWLLKTVSPHYESLDVAQAVSRATGASLAATVVRLRDVLGWRSSLLQWRTLNGTWRLSTTVGLPRHAHNHINTTPETRAMLDATRGCRQKDITVPVAVAGKPSAVRGELFVQQRTAVVLGRVG